MTALRYLLPLLLFALSALSLRAHAQSTPESLGTAIGGVLGGLLGNKSGSDSARKLGTIVGVAAGGLIGGQIGKLLNEKDKQQAGAATRKALDSGSPQTWENSSSGNSGTVQVVDASARPPTTPSGVGEQSGTAPARTCKTVKQTITLKDGSTFDEDVTACKGPNGWETV